MAVSYRGASNAAGQNAGVTTPAGTTSITPTLPASTAIGDRVFMVQCANNTSATAPANWTLLGTKDTVIGTGAVAAGGGLRYMTVYWRDRDSAWAMPAMDLISATQNSHWIGAVSVQKGTYDTWDTPTISTVGGSFNTLTTNYTDTSAASFTTHSNGFLIIGSCFNDNVTSSAVAVTQSGATFGTVTERCDGGTATGNDVAGKVHTCSVTTGAAATITQTQTLSTGSQGETLFIEQTVTYTPPAWPVFQSTGTRLAGTSGSTANIPVPASVAADDIIFAFVYIESGTTVTVTSLPTGFAEAANSPAIHGGGSNVRWRVYWKRATGADAGTYDFTLSGSTWRTAWAARYTGCITSGNPIDVSTSGGTNGDLLYPDTSVTTTVDNTLLLWAGSHYDGRACTQPSGFTKDAEGETGGLDSGMCLASKSQVSAGSTGTLSATAASGTNSKAVWLGALKPPAGAAAVVARSRGTIQVPIIRSSLY